MHDSTTSIYLRNRFRPLDGGEPVATLKIVSKVAGHIPARILDVPSWDAETIFYKFWALHKAGARATMKKSKFSSMSMIFYKFLKKTL
jgi:hypothetical protein